MTVTTNSSTRDQDRLRALLAARAAGPRRPAERTGPAPLSAAQRRMWFESQLQPDSPAYLVPVLLRLRGALDRAAMLGAVRDLAERHQVLRGVVDASGPQPVIVTRPAGEVPLDTVDLGSYEDPRAELDRRVREHVRRPIAVERECPLRVAYFSLGDDDHALLLVIHHIATDAWSTGLLMADLGALYGARLGLGPVPPAPPQYAATVEPLPEELEARHLDWWQERLRDCTAGLDLPADHPHRPVPSDLGGNVPLVFSAEVTARLRALAAESGGTPFMVLIAAWQALLARLSGSDDIAVGVPDGGRRVSGSDQAVGLFVNTVVLRCDLSGDPTGRQLLERVRSTVLDGLSHADVPFDRVVERVRPQRTTGASPLFDTMANLYHRSDTSGLFAGLVAEYAEISTGSVKADLALQCFEREDDGTLSGVLQFRADRFTHDSAQRIADWYLRLLGGLLADPDLPVGALALAEPGTGVMRGPVRDYPLERPLTELVADWAESTPDAVAVTASDGALSYAELDRRANRVAHRLLAAGVCAEEPVAVLAERSLDLAVALLGVLKAGAAFVPLEPSYPDDRLARILASAGTDIVLAQRDLAGRVRAEQVAVIEEAAGDSGSPAMPPPVRVNPDQLAYLIFTSGSTGTPKGVAVEHRSLVHYLRGALERIGGHGRSFALLSTAAADLGYLSLFGALVSGGTLHLVERETATDPGRLAEYFATHPVDVVKMVPSHLELLATHGDLATVLPRRTLVLAGEACPWHLADRVRAARPDLTVHNHYGPTETTVSVLGCDLAEAGAPEDRSGAVAPLGSPFPNAVCYVVDPAGRLLPPTVPGELLIAGPGVSRGYLKNTEATRRAFVTDPLEGTRRCYRTGDRVRVRADGLIEFLGRLDDQVKVRGYRVELGEVAAACRALPEVREAVVLAVGEAHQRRLTAWLVPSGDEPLDTRAVRTALRAVLPDHMVPSAVVGVPGIPLTPNGKVDRVALPRPEAQGPADRTPPRTDTERRITAVWQEVLELPDADIDIDADFFALGGDSFRALRAARLIDPTLRVVNLFTRPTVRELAVFLDQPAEIDSRLLQRLAGPAEGTTPSVTVLCVPYGGGSAASYQPLAQELAVRHPQAEILAVELPGHDPAGSDEAMLTMSELVQGCRDELAQRAGGPVLVYGHCVGTAAAVALSLELEAQGNELAGVVLGASFPTARLPGRLSALIQRWFPNDRWTSDRAYREVLQALGGQLEEETEEAMIRAVRHDVRQATDWFSSQLDSAEPVRLRAPVLCVVGDRDRTTELFEERYREWSVFAEEVELARITGAGHYFLKHQAADLAELVSGRLAGNSTSVPAPLRDGVSADADAPAVAAGGSRRPSRPARRDLRDLRLFGLLALGQTASMTGAALTSFGLGVWVYQRTHQVGYYSLITMLAMLPMFFAAPVGGAVTDRYDRRRVLLGCAAVYGITLSGLIVAAAVGSLQVWEVAVFAGLTSLTAAFQRPAYLASVAQLVPKPYLAQANGITQLGSAISTLIAPLLGGALISLTGLTGVVCVDSVAVLAGAGVLLLVRFPDRLFRKRRESFASALTGGWRFIARRRPMVAMVVFFVVVNYITATTTVLTAPLVLSTANAGVLGLVIAAGALGAVAGGLAMAFWGGTRRRADGMIGMTIGMGLATVLIGLRPTPLLMGVGLFLWWVCNAILNAHWLAILQAKVGLDLQGRVVATNQMLATGMMPLGFLLTPLLYNHVFGPMVAGSHELQWLMGGTGQGRGMGLLMVVGGLLLTCWGVLGMRYRPLRHIEDRLPDIPTGSVIAADLDDLQNEADALHEQAAS
ncbi:amino acid adenylation domain-containing protein [Streptomyces sp. NBC_01571]|uniref:non-ribosomal peptide synthetase/MFS transporter n=1 Tax=Streptomyces sp. NBC_01571 TaxID=2975883 RepID=UPI00224F761F|nr:non-ribosomal peptide synthetase/MFS transporter [Streptomyces sp. NBC_01571]MCX4580496.1 amino acid adenylation domain-containing protein [Streptomyces sp. NBC_01571]